MISHYKRGFIKAIVVIVIGLILLAYWGYDIKNVIDSPEIKEKIVFIWNWVKDLWNNYLLIWLQWFWNHSGESLYKGIKGFFSSSSTSTGVQ